MDGITLDGTLAHPMSTDNTAFKAIIYLQNNTELVVSLLAGSSAITGKTFTPLKISA
jgi:hypothetical protein